MLTRAFDDRMLSAQRQGKTSFYMHLHRRRGDRVRPRRWRWQPRRHVLPDLPPAGLAHRRGWPLVDMMCQVFSNEKDRLNGRQLPVMYSVKRGRRSSRSPATSARNIRRPSAGRWRRRSRATRASPQAGSARARPRRPTSISADCSPPSTGRRSFSTSSTTSGRSRPSRASRAARALEFAARAHRLRHPGPACRRQRLSRGPRRARWAAERARANPVRR